MVTVKEKQSPMSIKGSKADFIQATAIGEKHFGIELSFVETKGGSVCLLGHAEGKILKDTEAGKVGQCD